MKAMETKTREGLEKARELLKEQAGLSPFHRVTPLYNLACVEALLGDKLEKSLEYLQEAVAAGWTDVEHIKKDSDLDRVRGLEGYQALLASLEADSSDEDTIHIEVNIPREEKCAAKEAKRADKEEKRKEKRQVKEETKAVPLTPVYPATPAAPVTSSAPAPTPVVPSVPAPSAAPAAGLTGSNSIDEFQTKLKTLEDMGFADRRRNITALVLARGDLVAAVQSLLSGQ